MKKTTAQLAIIALVGSLGSGVLSSQSAPVSPRIAALQQQPEAGKRAALEAFWQDVAKQGTPLVEPIPGDDRNVLVTFVWRAAAPQKDVILRAWALAHIEEAGFEFQMQALAGTDLWYRTYKLRRDLRFSYGLAADLSTRPSGSVAIYQTDPLNPRSSLDFNLKKESFVELPAATAQPWIQQQTGVPHGTVEEHRFKSPILGNERRVWVYTPAGYSESAKPYALLVLFDGRQYLEAMATPVTLDNLIAKGLLPPMVAVMIDSHVNLNPNARNLELHFHEPFIEFLAKELTPWMRDRYHVTSDPRETIAAGVSAGGLTAAYVGLRHPELFGNVLSQSGAFWWWKEGDDSGHEWLARQFVANPKLNLRFYMNVGVLEAGNTRENGPTMIVVNRHMRDVLLAKGYSVTYQEVGGGHSPVSWRGTLADGLTALLGPSAKR
jgi:enterochelin esterase-like enzyme